MELRWGKIEVPRVVTITIVVVVIPSLSPSPLSLPLPHSPHSAYKLRLRCGGQRATMDINPYLSLCLRRSLSAVPVGMLLVF